MKFLSLLIGQFDSISERKLFADRIGRQNEDRMIAIFGAVSGQLQIPTNTAVEGVRERVATHGFLRVAVFQVTHGPLESGLVHLAARLNTVAVVVVSSWA